jgi:hypothetical protein
MQDEWNKGDAPKQDLKQRERSDSDVARELQAQWEAEESGESVVRIAESKEGFIDAKSSELKVADSMNAVDDASIDMISIRAGLHRHDRYILS